MEGNIELLHCLQDIPHIIECLFEKKEDITKEFVRMFNSRDIRKIYISGQASGAYIGGMIKNFIEQVFNMEVQITNPYEFIINEKFNVNGVYDTSQLCMICPAHSGTTPGPVKMAELCKKLGICTISTTYDMNSPLALLSDVVINKYSGREKSYIETRGHFATITCLYLCFLEYGRVSGKLSQRRYEKYSLALKNMTFSIRKIIEETLEWYSKYKKILLDAHEIRYIASGEYVSAVMEGGLKIAETTHKSRLVYEVEEFMHSGTTEITKSSVIFLLLPLNKSYARMIELSKWCRMYCDNVIEVCAHTSGCDNAYENSLKLSCSDSPYFSVMEYMIPFEIMAYLLSEDLHMSVIHSANEDYYDVLNVHVR